MLTAAAPISAQTVVASYPLLTDLVDASGNYEDATLLGNPTPPDPPSNGVCLNGVYFIEDGGQDLQTGFFTTIDAADFMIEVEFNLGESAPVGSFGNPVIMLSTGGRFIGLYVDPNGVLGAKYNNFFFTWSSTTVTVGRWYAAEIRFEGGRLQLFLDGSLVHDALVGPLNSANGVITTNDYSTGLAMNGCVRNIRVLNDATLQPAADLGLDKTSDIPGTALPGDVATYTLTVTNPGPDDGSGVAVSDPLPNGLTYLSDTCGGSYDQATHTWSWPIGDLLADATVSCDVVVEIQPGARGSIRNTASVSGAEVDVNPANDTSTAVFNVGFPGIPELGRAGAVLLVLLLAGIGAMLLRIAPR